MGEKEKSSKKCNKKNAYGYSGKKAYADKNCYAEFYICYEPEDKETPPDNKNCKVVKIKSKSNKKKWETLKNIKKITSMKVKKEKSSKKCNQKNAYGYSGKKAYADKNCYAEFYICYEPEDKETPPDNVCELPKDKGPCEAAIKRFYYDSNTKKCKEFTYGGCQGNANNFESKEECQKECSPEDQETPPTPPSDNKNCKV